MLYNTELLKINTNNVMLIMPIMTHNRGQKPTVRQFVKVGKYANIQPLRGYGIGDSLIITHDENDNIIDIRPYKASIKKHDPSKTRPVYGTAHGLVVGAQRQNNHLFIKFFTHRYGVPMMLPLMITANAKTGITIDKLEQARKALTFGKLATIRYRSQNVVYDTIFNHRNEIVSLEFNKNPDPAKLTETINQFDAFCVKYDQVYVTIPDPENMNEVIDVKPADRIAKTENQRKAELYAIEDAAHANMVPDARRWWVRSYVRKNGVPVRGHWANRRKFSELKLCAQSND